MFRTRKEREVVCAVCGDTFTTRGGNAKYCPGMCQRIGIRRKRLNGRAPTTGMGMECAVCGKGFIRRNRVQVLCGSKQCSKDWERRRMGKTLLHGDIIQCALCGKDIVRRSANTKYCSDKCEPPENWTLKCVACGEEKAYTEYRDYRGRHANGKFHVKCAVCENKEGAERLRNKGVRL